jgi:hypothetical protein
MALFELMKGFGVAVGVAIIGVVVLALIEVLVALADPRRRPTIMKRNWRDNFHHMIS